MSWWLISTYFVAGPCGLCTLLMLFLVKQGRVPVSVLCSPGRWYAGIVELWTGFPSPLLTLLLWPLALPLTLTAQAADGATPLSAVGLSGRLSAPATNKCESSAKVLNGSSSSSEKGAAVDQWLMKSACDLAVALRAGHITSSALVDLCLARLEHVNPKVNAVVHVRAIEARAHAARCDEAFQKGTAPPWPNDSNPKAALFGIPTVIKECFEMRGAPFTGGVWARRHAIGQSDSDVVLALKAADVIVLGSTNTSEACMWFESDNPVYGRSNNPYALERTPGGSSGGCASAVAGRMCPTAVTSDVGGSTRIPAGYCGLFGLKPSGGLISNRGTFPSTGSGAVDNLCQIGPTCCHPDDLWPLLCALPLNNNNNTQEEGGDKRSVLRGHPSQVSLSSLRVIDLGQPLGSWLLRSNQPRSFQDAHSACLAGLVALGATPLASLTSSSAAAHAAANAGAGARNAGDPRRLAALQSAKSTLAEGALGFEIWSEIMDAHKPEPFLATITRECGASSRSGGVNNGNGNGTAGCSATESTIHGKARQGSWAAAKLLVSAFTTALVGPPYTSDAAVDATGGGDATSSGAASTGGEGSKSTISGVDTRHYQRNEQQQQQVEGYQRRVHTVPAAALALVEHWAACAPKARQDATRARGQELKKDLVAALGDDGVAVWPSLPHVAPRHGGESLVRFLDSANTSLLNALELPALAIPMGLSKDDKMSASLPVSVQLIAAPGNEHLLVAAACALHAKGVAVSPTPF